MNRAKWYPNKLPEKAVWHANENKQAQENGKEYGLSNADIAQIAVDNDTIQFLADGDSYVKAEVEEWNKMRDEYIDGVIGSTKPKKPNFAVGDLPVDALPGIGDRAYKISEKIKASDNYSPAVGAAWRIINPPKPVVPEADLKPKPKVVSIGNWRTQLKVPLKDLSGVRVFLQRGDNADAWDLLGNFPNGTIIDDTPPLVANQPEVRRYRMYFLKGNEVVGEVSDIVETTTHA